MPEIEKSALVLHSAAQMFALVDDVEHYPQFLPWCQGSEVHFRDAATTIATIRISWRGIEQSFTTENANFPHERIALRQPTAASLATRGIKNGTGLTLFTELHGQWQFQALQENACKVILQLRYSMATPFLASAVGPVFGLIAATLVERFVARADALYDPSPADAQHRVEKI
jgi:ribosome-associated toxin RatA of RatAB toxin-antitoxin module